MDLLGLIAVGVILCILAYAVFLAILDGNARQWPDEDSTTDVQNHWGDSRPVR